jgi:hypothetical protein
MIYNRGEHREFPINYFKCGCATYMLAISFAMFGLDVGGSKR